MPKTIFGTTEKSNFILNMKDETIERLPLTCAKLLTILMLVGQALPDVVEVVAKLMGKGSGKAYGFLNTPFICLTIVWVVSIILLVILGARQRFVKRHHMPLVVLLAVGLVCVVVSTVRSYSPLESINGAYGRTTGLLTILSCVTILLVMSFNGSEGYLRSILKTLVVCSAVQCAWGVVQILSNLVDVELSYYENLNSISLYGVCLPSGFSGSPIFYAEYLGLMLGITLTLATTERSKFYTVMSIVYSYLMVDTHTVVGVVGLSVVVVVVVVLMVVGKVKNVLPLVCCIVSGAIALGVSYAVKGGYTFYDGAIMWQDSFYRIGATGYYWADDADFDVNDVAGVFEYLWGQAVHYVKLFPLVGTGADCLGYAQLGSAEALGYVLNSFDLVYNDYLQVAVTMGIPTLVVYVATLVFCYIRLAKKLKSGNVYRALLVSMVAFCVMGTFSVSAITIVPYACVLLGLACSKEPK